ncbi:MAG: response regulator receiver domain [Verrucomicrobiota bacterium]
MKIEARKNIAKRFLQTLLWIDDEIVMDEKNEKFQSFFKPASEAISKEGMICQLFRFTNTNGHDDPYGEEGNSEIETIKRLITKADIVIVDWHLGAEDPRNAISIIDTILASQGTRFCVVLSQEPKIEEEFNRQYKDKIKIRQGDLCLTNEDGSKFFMLFKKDAFEKDQHKKLLPNIISLIAATYKDYIHWVAIEIMANVKDQIPTLLSQLPKETDNALMAERLINEPNNELSTTLDFAISAIGDDLYDIVTEMNLDLVKTCSDQFEKDEAYHRLKLKSSSILAKKCSELAQLAKDKMSDFSEFCPGYGNLTRLFEQKSLDQSLSKRVYQGAVYQMAGETRYMYICISQPCDCNTKDSVLLLKGSPDKKFTRTAPGKTYVTFNNATYVILPDPASCCVYPVADSKASRSGLEGLNYVGGLRASVAMRIADRFFSHQTRVGVNQPRIIRDIRQNS